MGPAHLALREADRLAAAVAEALKDAITGRGMKVVNAFVAEEPKDEVVLGQ